MQVTELDDGRYKITADSGKVLVNSKMIALDNPIIFAFTDTNFTGNPKDYVHEVSIEDFYKFRQEVAIEKCKTSKWIKVAEVLSMLEEPKTVMHLTLTAVNLLIFLLWILLR